MWLRTPLWSTPGGLICSTSSKLNKPCSLTRIPMEDQQRWRMRVVKAGWREKIPCFTQDISRKILSWSSVLKSSGTTDGRQKYVPFTQHSAQTTLQIFQLTAAYRSRVYPVREGGRILEFMYSSKQFKTKRGLMTGTATTHYFTNKEFEIKQDKTKTFTCSPMEVISSGDYKQSTYCHLLLGLTFS